MQNRRLFPLAVRKTDTALMAGRMKEFSQSLWSGGDCREEERSRQLNWPDLNQLFRLSTHSSYHNTSPKCVSGHVADPVVQQVFHNALAVLISRSTHKQAQGRRLLHPLGSLTSGSRSYEKAKKNTNVTSSMVAHRPNHLHFQLPFASSRFKPHQSSWAQWSRLLSTSALPRSASLPRPHVTSIILFSTRGNLVTAKVSKGGIEGMGTRSAALNGPLQGQRKASTLALGGVPVKSSM
ncbi:hypothetical protein TcWFU_006734 [Taenia crassiceps]|uniref:Uncharacterized protein n=1 Tax=Taenia crassiceps TaxID=6207 RepID=A0ABR4Q9U5_9CEST